MRFLFNAHGIMVQETFVKYKKGLGSIDEGRLRRSVYFFFPDCVPDDEKSAKPDHWGWQPLRPKCTDGGLTQHAVKNVGELEFGNWLGYYQGAEEVAAVLKFVRGEAAGVPLRDADEDDDIEDVAEELMIMSVAGVALEKVVDLYESQQELNKRKVRSLSLPLMTVNNQNQNKEEAPEQS